MKSELNDDEVGVLVDAKLKEAVGWFSSKLSTEREQVMRYYNGEYPKRNSSGSTSYISSEVYDGVEAAKAQLLETFASGRNLVKFDPETAQDIDGAAQASAVTDYVVFRQNDGYKIFNDAIDDALKARVGVVKIYWQEQIDYVDHHFNDLGEDHVQGLATHDDIHFMDATQDAVSGLYSGKLTKKIDRSYVKLENIAPEEFVVEPQCKGLSKDIFCSHRKVRTIDDLLKEGYDKDKLALYNMEEDDELHQMPEVLARFQQTDSGYGNNNDRTDDLRLVLVNECYWKLKRPGDEYARLYQIIRCGNVTLEITEVDDLPFVVYVPLPIPHSFYGNNFAQRIIPAQNVRTVLTRSIVDHATITNNPRYQVLKGGLTNPKELLDNRLGGIVNVTRENAVSPLEQANLNPFVFQTLELIKTQNEEMTGISSLSKGLNKDAISKQNSAAMVDNLVDLSMIRQKTMARQFAYGFLIPLYLKVYSIVLMKESKKSIVDLTGNFVEVDVSRWMERKAASASLHLGYGELEKEADKLMKWASGVSNDDVLGQAMDIKGRMKLAIDVANKLGIYNAKDYLLPPEQVQPKGPDPIQMGKTQADQMKAQAALNESQASASKVQMHGAIEQMRAKIDQMNEKFEQAMKLREEDRKDADIKNKIDIAQREMRIAEATPTTGEQISLMPTPR